MAKQIVKRLRSLDGSTYKDHREPRIGTVGQPSTFFI